jgi:cystathionine beta-lyase/cystathionine gamma-synthase
VVACVFRESCAPRKPCLEKDETMPDYTAKFHSLDTNLVHAGRPRPQVEGAVVTPIFQSANYLMGEEATYDAVRSIRLSNSPNHHTLQARLATVESAEAALLTASGMAAISTAILAHLQSGEHLLTQRTLYGGTQSFLDRDAVKLGISHTAIDIADPLGADSWQQALTPKTRLIFVEAISNPLMEVGDLRAVVEFARRHELVSVIDNTFATPVNFRPVELGFDLVVHSATKYLNGHSDLVAGAVIGSQRSVDRVRQLLLHLGGSLDPHTCFLLERGLKTLALRVGRQNSTAADLARFLEGQPAVRRVNYPGLASSPSHRYASQLFSGFGGMVSFYLGEPEKAQRFLDRLKVPIHAASLGGVESLVVRPARSSHLGLAREERERLGISEDLIRVSVGIEDAEELIADFEQALAG